MSPTKYAIAICDDEKYWQNQILNCCKLLENDINFNFEYHIFSSGEDVLKYQSNIDILLLDEELPGTSGQSIKEQFEASNKNTIIIFITSHNEIVYDSFGKNVYGFQINHKVIFDYLFKSSYMPVQPIVTGFSGIFRYGRYSQIFLYPRMFWCSKVVGEVVNSPFTTYAISRFISVIDVSEVVCA